MRTTTENGELALLLEVSGTPKPGNVDRHREYDDLRFEHFVTGAVCAREGLQLAADGTAVGEAFRRAVAGMSQQSGGNTQFGALLVVTPLVRAAVADELTPAGTRTILEETTVEDAAKFYEAFEYVDVAVDDPPDGMEPLDVRRGADAVPTLRAQEITLEDLMERSADRDGVAAELVNGYPRTFEAAAAMLDGTGPVTDRAARAYLDLLADEVDTFVVTKHDRETAEKVRQRAQAVRDGEEDVDTFADDLVERGINPGTTADIVAGALFVALERGLEV
ncbi:triphosphoribosyl-dephospho-CoA synthase [Salinibaculum rarum]|uniref:triphosphoribosyl-dephospho-CoA synthase n=1 Tax=Salinibaculum rarum TaxID=3058903 RepID=UPI00265E4434|nr:triphosphoribosyl-dephospho-CoA synthase [Salinibaculum sp. KK48]